jgi:hypothetical protein
MKIEQIHQSGNFNPNDVQRDAIRSTQGLLFLTAGRDYYRTTGVEMKLNNSSSCSKSKIKKMDMCSL